MLSRSGVRPAAAGRDGMVAPHNRATNSNRRKIAKGRPRETGKGLLQDSLGRKRRKHARRPATKICRSSAMAKPVLFVTRRMPPAVEARLLRDYDARLNPDDRVYTADDLAAGAAGADAMLVCSDRQHGV